MLWIALELPSLPLQIVERAGPCRDPLVISDGPAQRPSVFCANEAAKAAGVREGQAVAAAKALADLRVVVRDVEAERQTLERIAAWALQFTPMVNVEPQGIVLEVESSLRLFEGHAKLTSAIRNGARDLGFHAVLGIAPTPLAARIIARAEARGLQVRSCLAPDQLRERIADLPLFLFDWPEKTLARLTDLGVLRLRDMLALPPEGIARRFGPEIVLSLDRLLGRVTDPRLPYVAPPQFHAKLDLPAEADGVEALVFPLRRMLAEFEGAMRGLGAGVQQLGLVLEHGRKARTRLALDFASPEREADFILSIAREKLGRLALSSPTIALSLHAGQLLAYVPRSSAWLPGPKEQSIDRDRLIQRLSARLGRGRVFGIALKSEHRPEKNWIPAQSRVAAAGMGRAHVHPVAGRGPITRPAWLFHRPQRLVTQDGEPTYQGELTLIAGPERIEAGWWDGEEVSRDYYVAANARGEAFWIYREHQGNQAWYMHGVYG